MTECHQDRAGDAFRHHGGDERLRAQERVRGTWSFAPFTPSTIAPIMGPSRSAAGNRKAPQPAKIATESDSNASHCSGTGQLPSRDLTGSLVETSGVLIRR